MLRDFSALVRDLADDGWEPERRVGRDRRARALRAGAAVHRAGVSRDIHDHLLQSYVAAREADMPVGLVRERDGLETDARLLLAPCAKLLTGPGLERLRQPRPAAPPFTSRTSPAARRTSADRGSRGFPSCSASSIGSGTASSTRSRTTRSCSSSSTDLGELTSGTRLTFAVSGEPSARSYLPVEPRDADVVAIDSYGRPALLRRAPRRRPGRLLHVSAGAHGGADTVGEPGEHVADLLRARDARGSRAADPCRRPTGARGRPARRHSRHGGARELLVVGGLAPPHRVERGRRRHASGPSLSSATAQRRSPSILPPVRTAGSSGASLSPPLH